MYRIVKDVRGDAKWSLRPTDGKGTSGDGENHTLILSKILCAKCLRKPNLHDVRKAMKATDGTIVFLAHLRPSHSSKLKPRTPDLCHSLGPVPGLMHGKGC